MRIIYCRIAFMKYYNGPSADDKPLYGGAYNKTNTGHEVHNFHANNGNYYGFFQPGSNKRSKKDWNDVIVGNITGNKKDMQADDVLVVWVAKIPDERGQFITGWYKNATVYRTMQELSGKALKNRSEDEYRFYNVKANIVDCRLLPVEKRNFEVKGMGHANYWYGEETKNKEVLEYIENYRDENPLEQERLQEIRNIEKDVSNLKGEDREVLTKQRVNQSKFRIQLIEKYHKCCLCGMSYEKLLRASHIKPWSESNKYERLKIENGLLLCPNHDLAFDQHLIAFDDDGGILISRKLSAKDRKLLNIKEDMKIDVSSDMKPYLEYHRKKFWEEN